MKNVEENWNGGTVTLRFSITQECADEVVYVDSDCGRGTICVNRPVAQSLPMGTNEVDWTEICGPGIAVRMDKSSSSRHLVTPEVRQQLENLMQWHWGEWQPEGSPTKPRFALQFKEGDGRAIVQGRFDNVDAADKELRDQALGLAQQLERWATRPYVMPYPPAEVAEGAEPPIALKP